MDDLFGLLEAEDRGSFAPVEYVLPTMQEILSRPGNGLTAVGSFSGCGGSSLGLKMAGWKMAAAIEFVPEAAATYRANFPDTVVFERDIRKVTAEEILEAIGMKPGELDLFEGSPPCSSFSSAGMGDRYRAHTCAACHGTGKAAATLEESSEVCPVCNGEGKFEGVEKKYSDTAQTTDDLFEHWMRLLGGLQPRGFLAENVPGMLSGTALADYAHKIVPELSRMGYHVEARVMDAAHYGVPQRRKRLIFAGVRRDVADGLAWPPEETTAAVPFTTRQGLAAVPADRHGDHGEFLEDSSMEGKAVGRTWHMMTAGTPEARKALKESCARCGEDLKTAHGWKEVAVGAVSKERGAEKKQRTKMVPICKDGERGVEVKDYFLMVVPKLDEPCPTITATGAQVGAASVVHPTECRKFTPAEVKALSGFPLDFKLTGTRDQRYERIGRTVMPPLYEVIGKHLAGVLAR
jgi:DNA (cytosine-5)-methyltransferase 1